MATKVSFKNEDGHVLVVFPDQRERNGMIGVLSRAEGHSTADAGYIRGLKAATAEQRVAGERLLRDAGYPAKPAKRNPLLANPRSHTISTAKGSFSSPDLHRVCAWQARHQGSFASIDGENVDDIDFDDEDLGACVRKVQARLKRAKRNPLLANPDRYGRLAEAEIDANLAVVDARDVAHWRQANALVTAEGRFLKQFPGRSSSTASARRVIAQMAKGLLRGKKSNPLLANPTYRAVLDSEASPRSVRSTLEHAGFTNTRVRTVKGTGKKKAPGAYALFVRKHMADFKGRMSAPEAMKAIGALWRSRGGVKSNPLLANPDPYASTKRYGAQRQGSGLSAPYYDAWFKDASGQIHYLPGSYDNAAAASAAARRAAGGAKSRDTGRGRHHVGKVNPAA